MVLVVMVERVYAGPWWGDVLCIWLQKYQHFNPVGGDEYWNGDDNSDELGFVVPMIIYLKRRNWGRCQDLLVNFI